MASYLLYLTSLCYHICQMIIKEHRSDIYSMYQWFNMSLWVFSFLLRLYVINYICESVSLKANKIDRIIHRFTSTLRYADIWKEICQFSLQLMYHQLKFTGMGLFYFGNSFFRKRSTNVRIPIGCFLNIHSMDMQ
ncbi:uncharacterized protein LOC105428053 [Pogonomyrmex barbatus]|uniref:Uncharacterized protein LOC105428053 n=1 Tax=Pogonomyrmex barbatus TaxID=144034 RepID=A0A6I9WCB6_9HYME|nr:uncharacterized protein LOC105428053 [Pogonomyrmex barbatus]